MFYSDVIDMLCLYIQQSLFDLLQNSINELLFLIIGHHIRCILHVPNYDYLSHHCHRPLLMHSHCRLQT